MPSNDPRNETTFRRRADRAKATPSTPVVTLVRMGDEGGGRTDAQSLLDLRKGNPAPAAPDGHGAEKSAPARGAERAGAPAAGPDAPPGIISTENLGKSYGKREVVRGINISVRAGEIVGLLGPNGAGKTTSFYMIVGLVQASKGRVLLDGRDITRLPMWRRSRLGIGYLPQEASIFRKLTVWENVMAIVETMDMPEAKRKEHTSAILSDLALTHLLKQPAYTLSGGERRRLEIARALATRPRFMLLDEPFSGVDPISVAEVQNIVRGLKRQGIGVLITDHNVRETLSIVDRAYLIHQGRVFVDGPSEFIINDEQSRKFYLGEGFRM
jgi:lipopolysaccharide export system ATP-binding protein